MTRTISLSRQEGWSPLQKGGSLSWAADSSLAPEEMSNVCGHTSRPGTGNALQLFSRRETLFSQRETRKQRRGLRTRWRGTSRPLRRMGKQPARGLPPVRHHNLVCPGSVVRVHEWVNSSFRREPQARIYTEENLAGSFFLQDEVPATLGTICNWVLSSGPQAPPCTLPSPQLNICSQGNRQIQRHFCLRAGIVLQEHRPAAKQTRGLVPALPITRHVT